MSAEPWRAAWTAFVDAAGFARLPPLEDDEIDPDWRTAWTASARAAIEASPDLAELRAAVAVVQAERDGLAAQCDKLRALVDDFTHAVIDLDTHYAIVKAAHAVRAKAGLPVIDSFSKPGGK